MSMEVQGLLALNSCQACHLRISILGVVVMYDELTRPDSEHSDQQLSTPYAMMSAKHAPNILRKIYIIDLMGGVHGTTNLRKIASTYRCYMRAFQTTSGHAAHPSVSPDMLKGGMRQGEGRELGSSVLANIAVVEPAHPDIMYLHARASAAWIGRGRGLAMPTSVPVDPMRMGRRGEWPRIASARRPVLYGHIFGVDGECSSTAGDMTGAVEHYPLCGSPPRAHSVRARQDEEGRRFDANPRDILRLRRIVLVEHQINQKGCLGGDVYARGSFERASTKRGEMRGGPGPCISLILSPLWIRLLLLPEATFYVLFLRYGSLVPVFMGVIAQESVGGIIVDTLVIESESGGGQSSRGLYWICGSIEAKGVRRARFAVTDV
ncbi:hypothetical protein C8F04DRAFT_1176478 [Mycena alexandri]|uniref:Uncharacterized protein n=1 Tax=Mycena alexandri TaxID=1745969 RepID=A0AAD6XA50_9AGAR|nr:hypothetical protein C8F04DRAFT_1176478 [Mycena alexandri]